MKMDTQDILKEKEEMERICFNCSHFFPASEGPTEFGICVNDEAFEPFIEELFENLNYDSCRDLIDSKKFDGEQEACPDFEEVEIIEIDDDSPLARGLSRLRETGKFDLESLKMTLLEEEIKNIDWKTMPVDQYVKQLRNPKPEEQQAAMSSLGAMINMGNMEAFKELFNFFKELPPPRILEEVHFKQELLRHLRHRDTKISLIPTLINELYRTPSNNTTKQWIRDIFKFLSHCPLEEVRGYLEEMLVDKRFSHRLKQKIKNILYQ